MTTTPAMLRYDILADALAPDNGRSRVLGVMASLGHVDRAEEADRGRAFGDRIAKGLCAALGGWCLTHNVAMDPGHANYMTGASLD
jgi:hypothetical protein